MRLSWLVWISALAITTLGVIGLTSHAEAADSGDLIKCDGSQTVYYVGEDNKRYTFPNDKIFQTWYSDFDEIQNVTCEEVQSHTLGGVVKYRQGMRLIKMPSVPVVYAVSPNGILRPIKSEAKAKKLYGDNWAKQVDDLSEAFFPQYSVGEELGEEELPEGMLVEDTDGSVLQVDEDGEVVNVDDVLDRKQKALLRKSAVGKERLEARLGKALSRIQELENEIARLQRALDKLKTVKTRQSTTTGTSPSRTQTTRQTRDDDTKLPDLTVSNIDLDGTAIRATLKNIGSANAGATHIYFWLDGVLEWTYSSTTLADQSFLLAGGSSFITPQQIVGQRTIKVCVDPLNAVAESSELNNCLTQTLDTGDGGDFEITLGSVDAIDALGNAHELLRSFGFSVSAPMDHFTITIYNPSGSIHDQLVQQVSSPSPLAWYVSPSWLTQLQSSTTYTYTIHAEEYGTGDVDDVSGTFTTLASPFERRLRDADGDGYGNPNNYAFVQPAAPWVSGYVDWIIGRDDCNDQDANIYPGQGCLGAVLQISVNGPAVGTNLQIGGTSMVAMQLLFGTSEGSVNIDHQEVCFNGSYTTTRDIFGESFTDVSLAIPTLGFSSPGTLISSSGADCFEFEGDVTLPENTTTTGYVNVSLASNANLEAGQTMFAEYQLESDDLVATDSAGDSLIPDNVIPFQNLQGTILTLF